MLPLRLILTASLFWAASVANEVLAQEEFIPTHEWQLIPPNTAVPPGLHYRMDLATGEKWAKLLDEEPKSAKSVVAVEPAEIAEPDDAIEPAVSPVGAATKPAAKPAAKPAVKPVETETSDAQASVLDPFQQKEKILLGTGLFDDVLKPDTMTRVEYEALVERLWAQRQAEVRAVYEMMEHADQVIDPFIQTLWDARPGSSPELLEKLQKLEELVSTEDMALVFVQRGGWIPLVNLLQDKFPTCVRTAAAWVIGAALRQNEENKAWILEPSGPGAVPLRSALYRLMEIVDSRGPATDEALLSKAVFAIAAAGDTNQEVQTHLLGPFLTSLGRMLSEDWTTTLRIKVLQLGYDLLLADDPSNSEHYARLRMSLKSWCEGIQHLTAQVIEEPNKLEKAMQAAAQVKELCPSTAPRLVATFQRARDHYLNHASPDMDPAYKEEILQALAALGAA